MNAIYGSSRDTEHGVGHKREMAKLSTTHMKQYAEELICEEAIDAVVEKVMMKKEALWRSL